MIILLFIFVLAFFSIFLSLEPFLKFLNQKTIGKREEIIKTLDLLMISVSISNINNILFGISFGVSGIFFLLFFPNLILAFIFSILSFVGVWQLAPYVLKSLHDKRCSKVAYQLPDALIILSNGIKSGLSITQSIERASLSLPSPIKEEFSLILSEVRLGRSIEDALQQLFDRVPNQDIEILTLSINVLKETGGNMAETFDTLSYVIRERIKLKKKIEAMMAQSLFQGKVIMAMPFVMLGGMTIMFPEMTRTMYTTALGIGMLLGIVFLVGLGGIIIRSIVNIRV